MEELLMCSVCIERYHENKRHPVLLPRCGHSFCRPCIAMLVSGGCIVCPTCRTDQRIDHVERLPTEYTLLAIINAQECNKKETCERHCVKLSFWCRTCQKPTCGECLFEDHPTHTHDVIRAAKYINDMKQNAQEVAVKFMEALDEREQNYYRIIFNSAKRISWAIRSIGILRKDMEDARELMKGIKEEESISAAVSLSEAAKFLGLKWNIQDANYNRQIKNEEIKDEIQIEKEKAQEEDAKRQKELKEQEEKKSLKEEKPKEKNIKKILRKSKTLSSVEMMKEVQQVNETSKKAGKENNKVNQKPKTADKEVQTNEIVKLTEKVSMATQTTEELKPLKVEENLKGKIETKVEPELKSEISKQNDDSTKNETKSEAKVEDEQTDKETKEDTKKVEENNGKSETKKEGNNKKEEITINDIIKQKDLLKRKDSTQGSDSKPIISKDKIPDLSTLKSRANANQKAKQTLKKPTMEDKATQWEDIEPAPEKDTENTKNEEKMKPEKKSVTISESEPEIIEFQSIKKEDEEEEEVEEEEDDEEEELEKKEEKNLKNSEEGAVSSAVSSDSGLSESSKITKKKDAFDDCQIEGKLSEFIHVPGFMLCVEAEDGRLGSLEWGPQGLHIHCLQFTHVSYDIVIRDTVLNALIPSKSPVVFLELTADHTIIGRVYIKLWGHLRRAHNFISLCLGDQGKSYMNTKFLQVYNVNSSGERILGGDYEYNNGRGGKGLIDDMEWNGDYAMPMKVGMITAAGSGQSATNSLFLICTQSDPTRNFSCPYGIVYEGLKVVKDAVQLTATKQVWITDCGVVLSPPNYEQSSSS